MVRRVDLFPSCLSRLLPNKKGYNFLQNLFFKSWIFFLTSSVFLHVLGAYILLISKGEERKKENIPIRVKIQSRPEPKKIEPVKKEEEKIPIPPKKEVLSSKKPKKKKKTNQDVKQPVMKPNPPIHGLNPKDILPGGTVAVPLGNSLAVEDEGVRKKPTEIASVVEEDQSSDAKLVTSSVITPVYTEEALDAGLERLVAVDVYVDAEGLVTSAELRTPIGYGMDQRLLDAAKKAKFIPRKDAKGRPIPGWTEMKFRLEIP